MASFFVHRGRSTSRLRLCFGVGSLSERAPGPWLWRAVKRPCQWNPACRARALRFLAIAAFLAPIRPMLSAETPVPSEQDQLKSLSLEQLGKVEVAVYNKTPT